VCRILVVDDEVLVAYDVAQIVEDLGATVIGPAHDLERGLALADTETIDLALLDVNLGTHLSTPIAERLRDRGIPFVVISGYNRGHIPAVLAGAELLRKPCTPEAIRRVLTAMRRAKSA
jgi:CheY-like chemotaxis protein